METRKLKFLDQIYWNQRTNSRSRGHSMPQYTREAFKQWALKNEKFHFLWAEWLKDNCASGKRPSFDRLDISKGYSFDNLQVITLTENVSKEYSRRLSHKISQFTLDGLWIKDFHSATEAAKEVGTYTSGITSACKRSGKAKGYKWRYSNDATK